MGWKSSVSADVGPSRVHAPAGGVAHVGWTNIVATKIIPTPHILQNRLIYPPESIHKSSIINSHILQNQFTYPLESINISSRIGSHNLQHSCIHTFFRILPNLG